MGRLSFAGCLIVLAFFIALILGYDMNILTLGDQSAKSLGLNVARVRFVDVYKRQFRLSCWCSNSY